MAEGFRQRLREGGVKPQDLVITRVLSQKVEDYKVDTPTALAARQLENAGSTASRGRRCATSIGRANVALRSAASRPRRFWRRWMAMPWRFIWTCWTGRWQEVMLALKEPG